MIGLPRCWATSLSVSTDWLQGSNSGSCGVQPSRKHCAASVLGALQLTLLRAVRRAVISSACFFDQGILFVHTDRAATGMPRIMMYTSD